MEFALTGNETQIDGVTHVIHADMHLEEELPKIEARVRKCFEKETAHMITRAISGTNAASFFASSGNIDVLIGDLMTYIRELHTKRNFPITVRLMNFVSYTPLKLAGDAK